MMTVLDVIVGYRYTIRVYIRQKYFLAIGQTLTHLNMQEILSSPHFTFKCTKCVHNLTSSIYVHLYIYDMSGISDIYQCLGRLLLTMLKASVIQF